MAVARIVQREDMAKDSHLGRVTGMEADDFISYMSLTGDLRRGTTKQGDCAPNKPALESTPLGGVKGVIKNVLNSTTTTVETRCNLIG